MIKISVKQTKAFNEMSDLERLEWFDVRDKAVLHHIDTLYYSVYLKEPDADDEEAWIILWSFLNRLRELKAEKKTDRSRELRYEDLGLCLEIRSFSNYDICLARGEDFDIFICTNLPNVQTPRVVVQLRSRYLVLEGVKKAIRESYEVVREFIERNNLQIACVMENRIDYAFHTNCISDPTRVLHDCAIEKRVKSKFRSGVKFFKLSDKLKIETLQLGNRKSHTVFFRCYDKTNEVVCLKYKSFFFERWRQNGLISAFDRFCLESAYELGCYRSGILWGRSEWYLRYGKDPVLQRRIRDLREKYYIKSDNNIHLEEAIKGIVPEVTTIVNFEFQTQRRLYAGMQDLVDGLPKPDDLEFPDLAHLEKLLSIRKSVCTYLTSTSLQFVKDRKAKEPELIWWWQRIRECKIDDHTGDVGGVLRTYQQNVDKKKVSISMYSNVARLSALITDDYESADLSEDLSAALCEINDNDAHTRQYGRLIDSSTGEAVAPRCPVLYSELKRRKTRQLEAVLGRRGTEADDDS